VQLLHALQPLLSLLLLVTQNSLLAVPEVQRNELH
jgi:hypothetical protein